MKHAAAALVIVFFSASGLHAATPCDFKGISVGNKMVPADMMTALGVGHYKTNPVRPSFDETLPLVEKYGITGAAELQDWKIGPYCDDISCRIPYGITVGNNNVPASVFISFHDSLITEIDVSFSKAFWNDMLPIWDQKYGADWTVDRVNTQITDLETKKATALEVVSLNHVSSGVNPTTNDRCQISAASLDIIFKHHDPLGPYHSVLAIKLISKNF